MITIGGDEPVRGNRYCERVSFASVPRIEERDVTKQVAAPGSGAHPENG
jgi:hypothetical protein